MNVGTELVPIDRSEVSVVSMLEHAKQWLATAVETTGPAEIAAAKAQIATAETYARELHLSKDIQQDAQEMVRRAEYALGKAIRKGQAEGTIATRGQVRTAGFGEDRVHTTNFGKASPTDFAPHHELSGQSNKGNGIYGMAEAEPAEFETALTEAKAEGNVSRANVVRKVKSQESPATRQQRADLITDLAAQGYSSHQMAPKVGVTEGTVRKIARESGIDIPADKAIGRARRIDSTAIVANTATALEGIASGVERVDYDALDINEARQWVGSLTRSLQALTKFRNQLSKETS